MHISDVEVAMFVGLILSLVVSEVFGVVPGGMVVPGYLALICDTPIVAVVLLLVSLMVFFITKYVIARFVILYGRRRFVTQLLLAIIITLFLELIFPQMSTIPLVYAGVGVVVPALISNCFFRQGVKFTLVSLIPVTLCTFGVLLLYYHFV